MAPQMKIPPFVNSVRRGDGHRTPAFASLPAVAGRPVRELPREWTTTGYHGLPELSGAMYEQAIGKFKRWLLREKNDEPRSEPRRLEPEVVVHY